MARRDNNKCLFPLGIFLAVAAVTGTMMVGAHIIAASTLTPIVDTQAMGAAEVLSKIIGSGLIVAGVLAAIGTVIYKGENHNSDIAEERSKIALIASTTTIAVGIGAAIIGAIDPLATNVVRDLAVTTSTFAILAIGMMVFDRLTNKDLACGYPCC